MPEFLTNIDIKATPSARSHAARLGDVYDIVGSRMKEPVQAAATESLAGTYDSTGLILTASANGALTVDGVAVAANDRVLLPGQADQTQNGIYAVTTVGDGSSPWVLTRADDFDATSKIFTGVKVHVIKGASYADATFVLTTDAPVLDSTSLIWSLDTGKLEMVRQKIATITGSNGNNTTVYSLTHGWGTRAVTVDLIDTASGHFHNTVYADISRTSDNSVTVTLEKAPQDGENYMVIMRAQV